MTERWQREVRKLGALEPPGDLWERTQRGPRMPPGSGLPPRRSRIVAGVVAIVVFLAAGGFAWRALRPAGSNLGGPAATEDAIVATFQVVHGAQGGSGPSGTLATPNGVIAGMTSSYQWTSGNSVGNADTFGPPVTAKDAFVPVTVGSDLIVVADANSVSGSLDRLGSRDVGQSEPLYEYPTVVDFGSITGPVSLDQEPGRYVLHLVPSWGEGTVNFFFPIQLVTPEPSAVLSFVGKNAPEASLTWAGTDQQGVRGEYSWCGSDGCVTGIPEFASYPPVHHFLPVPADTPLRVEGDPSDLRGTFSTLENEVVSSMTLDAPGRVPTEPGRYVLRIDADLVGAGQHHGSATFFFGIDVTADVTQSPVSTVSPTFVGLAGTSWQLVSIDGVAVPGDAAPMTAGFSAHWLEGSDGCNDYSTRYSVQGSSMRFWGGSVTDVYCSGDAKVRADQLREALGDSAVVEVTGDRLTITSPNSTLTFERASS